MKVMWFRINSVCMLCSRKARAQSQKITKLDHQMAFKLKNTCVVDSSKRPSTWCLEILPSLLLPGLKILDRQH